MAQAQVSTPAGQVNARRKNSMLSNGLAKEVLQRKRAKELWAAIKTSAGRAAGVSGGSSMCAAAAKFFIHHRPAHLSTSVRIA